MLVCIDLLGLRWCWLCFIAFVLCYVCLLFVNLL